MCARAASDTWTNGNVCRPDARLTQPFYVPFAGIVSRPEVEGGIADLPAAIAILAYIVLHLAVHGLLRVLAARRPLT